MNNKVKNSKDFDHVTRLFQIVKNVSMYLHFNIVKLTIDVIYAKTVSKKYRLHYHDTDKTHIRSRKEEK